MTNGDLIRMIGDEELAELMTDEPCPPLHRRKRCPEERNCLECWAEWLKMDAEESANMKQVNLPYRANARLIAAAPEMYDALRWACFYNCKRPVMTADCEKCKINQALTMAGGEKWYRKVRNDHDLRISMQRR